jgi:predicted phosphoribosyltransferase
MAVMSAYQRWRRRWRRGIGSSIENSALGAGDRRRWRGIRRRRWRRRRKQRAALAHRWRNSEMARKRISVAKRRGAQSIEWRCVIVMKKGISINLA